MNLGMSPGVGLACWGGAFLAFNAWYLRDDTRARKMVAGQWAVN